MNHWTEWANFELAKNLNLNNSVYFYVNRMHSYVSLAKQSDGKSTDAGRSWRGNFTGRYHWTSGRLKGAYAGGSLRARGSSVIGYGTSVKPSLYPQFPGAEQNFEVLDLVKPYSGREVWDTDMFAGYMLKLAEGKYELKFQVNVRNVFDQDDLIEQRANSAGRVVRYTPPEPRRFYFTTTLGF